MKKWIFYLITWIAVTFYVLGGVAADIGEWNECYQVTFSHLVQIAIVFVGLALHGFLIGYNFKGKEEL